MADPAQDMQMDGAYTIYPAFVYDVHVGSITNHDMYRVAFCSPGAVIMRGSMADLDVRRSELSCVTGTGSNLIVNGLQVEMMEYGILLDGKVQKYVVMRRTGTAHAGSTPDLQVSTGDIEAALAINIRVVLRPNGLFMVHSSVPDAEIKVPPLCTRDELSKRMHEMLCILQTPVTVEDIFPNLRVSVVRFSV
jgi:hypothetical protein